MTPLLMLLETITEAEVRAWIMHIASVSKGRFANSKDEAAVLHEMPTREPFDLHAAARANGIEVLNGKLWDGLALCYDASRDEAVALSWDTMWWWQRRLPTELLWGWSLDDPRE